MTSYKRCFFNNYHSPYIGFNFRRYSMDQNEFINTQNKKYLDCCANLMLFYLKSSNEIVSIEDVLNNMNGDKTENKVILFRIIKSLNRHIYFNKVKLSYNDYLKLEKIVKDNKRYVWQLFPYIVSITSLLIACFSIIFAFTHIFSPVSICLIIAMILLIMVVFLCRIAKL